MIDVIIFTSLISLFQPLSLQKSNVDMRSLYTVHLYLYTMVQRMHVLNEIERNATDMMQVVHNDVVFEVVRNIFNGT